MADFYIRVFIVTPEGEAEFKLTPPDQSEEGMADYLYAVFTPVTMNTMEGLLP